MTPITIKLIFAGGKATMTYHRDERGRWTAGADCFDEGTACSEAGVLDYAKQADNWAEIRKAYFPMVGFHA